MIDQATQDKLIAEHGAGNLVGIEAKNGSVFVFRKPKRAEYNAWFTMRDQKEIAAGEVLAQQTLVYGGGDALALAYENEPALLLRPDGVVSSIVELAGASRDASKPKKF